MTKSGHTDIPARGTDLPQTFILDVRKAQQLYWRGTWAQLTPSQERLLELLAHNAGHVVLHRQLYYALTAGETIVEPQQVAWHISHLKTMTYALCGYALPIESITGRGYMLDLPKTHIIIINREKPDEAT